MNKLQRLRYDAPAEFLNPLAQIFLVINLADAIAFLFFSHTAAVQSIGLVGLAGPVLTVVFAVALIALVVLNTALLVTGKWRFGTAAAMLGFMIWTYATVLYAVGGLWLALIIHPLAQVAFWSWYFFMVKKYKD